MRADPQPRLHAAHALLPEGWARDVLLAWNTAGTLTTVSPDTPAPTDAPRAAGVLLPGVPNLHSHAFQRAFAGLAEYRGERIDVSTETRTDASADSFWTWRDLMYRFALAISPDQLEAVATQLYVEMLQAGYTAVCEFHYLHHDPQGRPYADPAEMALRLLAAARQAGIGITLLPVLYQHACFGATPPRAQQRRFVTGTDALLDIAARLRAHGAHVGIAPHSLRAVGPRALHEVVAGLHALDPSAPVHLHIAEQQREVDDCLAWCGRRPVEWLLANAAVDARWCLVHATHLSDAERRALAASGAVAGLCPSTEANLGDGVFDAAAYLAAGGAWGIGSDSHASVDAAGELRWLEYTQRLARQQRHVLASPAHRQVADRLWLGAVGGGARASGRALGGLAVGQQADFIVLDDSGTLAGLDPPQALANHVFALAGHGAVRDVWVAGVQRVHEGRHALERSACARFVAARRELLDEV
ncbi:MAG: formimidoylglutamate deiminase [Burkholderiales bacterium]|nr:formimidoylglutamate deiminase [Burkholderiales bacterium]